MQLAVELPAMYEAPYSGGKLRANMPSTYQSISPSLLMEQLNEVLSPRNVVTEIGG
jgi:hypothetical protein